MNEEGWYHGSVFERNFVHQMGPINKPRSKRTASEMMFRIIDFGRSFEEGHEVPGRESEYNPKESDPSGAQIIFGMY